MSKSAEVIPHRAARNRVAHLVVELSRIMHTGIFPDGRRLGAEMDAVLVACAVSIGHTERRPMTASKIAQYLGMPRTTVLRKLADLTARNVIVRTGKHYILTDDRLRAAEDDVLQCVALIRAAAAALKP